MLRAFILKRLDAAERELGESVDYLRYMVNTSLRAFLKFSKVLSVSRYRRVLPPAPWHVAQIVATRDEDCGPCVQIAVNVARKSGIDPQHIRATVEGRPDDLPDELADVYRFTQAVVTASGEDADLRKAIRGRYGDEGLVELALAIASCRVYPITKRALGYATSCSAVEVVV